MPRQNFLGAAIFPRKYGRSVKLERPDILGNFVAAMIFPGDDISCDTGKMRWAGARGGRPRLTFSNKVSLKSRGIG